MKIKIENIIINKGEFYSTSIYKKINKHILDGILSVTWADAHEFILNPTVKGNGVLPIKDNFISHLINNSWETEISMSLVEGLKPGPIDAIFKTEKGLIAVEWETGNISSSHRALNKIALGIKQKKLIAGFLILPMKNMAKYLTDRVGNYEELSPYFPLYDKLGIDEGVITVIGVEHDRLSKDVILIPKGKDGNAAK